LGVGAHAKATRGEGGGGGMGAKHLLASTSGAGSAKGGASRVVKR